MALSPFTKQLVEAKLKPYCENKIPVEIREKVKLGYKFRGNSVTLFEERPAFRDPHTWVTIVIAQFRFETKNKLWTLFCADRNSKWHEYIYCEPSTDLSDLIQAVEEDETCIFWG